jgi:predicted MPP superfamily phosphohydrolase
MPWIIRTHLTFGIVIVLFYLYFYFRLRGSLKTVGGGQATKYLKFIVPLLIYGNLFPLVTVAVYLFDPSLITNAVAGYIRAFDYFLVVPYWLGFAFVGQMFLFMIFTDVTRLVLFPLYRKYKTEWLRTQSYLFLGTAVFLLAYVPTKAYFDTNTVRVVQKEYRVYGLPEVLDGLRVAHIADIQADPRTREKKLSRYVRKINGVRPDIVVHSGDLVTSGQQFIEMGAEAFGSVEATYGVYACVGDHDHWSGSDSIRTALANRGVVYRDNKNEFIEVNGATIGISLVTDIYSRRLSDDTLDSLSLDAARADLRILVPHQVPERLVDPAKDSGYHLLLAGHTHGGQVVFGIPGLFLLQGSRLETPYVSGFFNLGSMLVSVNNGLGLTLAPIRFHAPASVSLITVRRAE